MSESLGARLRRRREEQSISLVTIADQTKIKLSLLEGLERDDVSHWPSGIFRRAYIRAYAQAIGLCPDVVVSKFLEAYPEPVEDLGTISAVASGNDGGRTSGGPPTRLRYLVGSAIGSLARLRRAPVVDTLGVADDASIETQREIDLEPSAPPAPVLPAATRSAPPIYAEPAFIDQTHEDPASVEELREESPPIEQTHEAIVATSGSVSNPAPAVLERVNPRTAAPDLLAVAHLCTEFGRVDSADGLKPLLESAATLLDATGLIVWIWDAYEGELRPALAHGYSARVLAHLPGVRADADNATAAAFRSAETRVIAGNDRVNGALAVPLLTLAGCAGVLALELSDGAEKAAPVRAVATIVAASLAQLIGGAQRAEVQSPPEMVASGSV